MGWAGGTGETYHYRSLSVMMLAYSSLKTIAVFKLSVLGTVHFSIKPFSLVSLLRHQASDILPGASNLFSVATDPTSVAQQISSLDILLLST